MRPLADVSDATKMTWQGSCTWVAEVNVNRWTSVVPLLRIADSRVPKLIRLAFLGKLALDESCPGDIVLVLLLLV